MRQLITVTGNLLLEFTAQYVRPLQLGQTHRALSMDFQVGGKGVNVSRVARQLGIPGKTFVFTSGPIGELALAWLRERPDLGCESWPLPGGCRVGWVAQEAEGRQTTLLGADLPLALSSWESAMLAVAGMQPGWVAYCGSFPGWTADFLKPIQRELPRWHAQGIQLAVDSYGPALLDLLQLPLALVKINRDEWNLLCATSGLPADPQTGLAKACSRWSVQNWVVTDGPNPLWWVTPSNQPRSLPPSPAHACFPTGAGDTMLAALLCKLELGETLEEALLFALKVVSKKLAQPSLDGCVPPN